MGAAVTTDAIIAIIGRYHFTYADEEGLQEALADLLGEHFPTVRREVWLGDFGRIDLLVERIGIEVKVQGSTADVLRQVQRYCNCEELDEILVVTTRLRHSTIERVVGGKRISVISIGIGGL